MKLIMEQQYLTKTSKTQLFHVKVLLRKISKIVASLIYTKCLISIPTHPMALSSTKKSLKEKAILVVQEMIKSLINSSHNAFPAKSQNTNNYLNNKKYTIFKCVKNI